MARKGGKHHLKRIASPTTVALSDKKKKTFYLRADPGPALLSQALPAGSLLRDVLGYAKTLSEAKKIISSGKVFVDGKRVRSIRFPIGLMAGIYLKDEEKFYRLLLSKGVLEPQEINKEEYLLKKLKIVRKFRGPKGRIMLSSHDGRVLEGDKAISIGDTVVFDLSSRSIREVFRLREGADVLITSGKHSGVKGKLKAITEHGNIKEAVLESNGQELITRADYLMVIG